jgi:putative endonuclease
MFLKPNFFNYLISPKKISRHMELGAWGEQVAAKELKRRGFKILYRNYRGPHGGEIDLICRDQETLVFVEVKTRSSEKYSRPLDAVNRKKQKLIQRGALAWLRLLGHPDLTFRFDVVEVIASKPPEVRIIENAFGMPEWFRY